jgi:hypothetical protein
VYAYFCVSTLASRERTNERTNKQTNKRLRHRKQDYNDHFVQTVAKLPIEDCVGGQTHPSRWVDQSQLAIRGLADGARYVKVYVNFKVYVYFYVKVYVNVKINVYVKVYVNFKVNVYVKVYVNVKINVYVNFYVEVYVNVNVYVSLTSTWPFLVNFQLSS